MRDVGIELRTRTGLFADTTGLGLVCEPHRVLLQSTRNTA